MYCRNCGAKLPDGCKFCTNCGTPVSDSGSDQAQAEKTEKTEKIADQTVVMPSPSPAADATQQYAQAPADQTVLSPEPAAPYASAQSQQRRSGGSHTATIVLGVIAAVAVIALVLVVADPFKSQESDAETQVQAVTEDVSAEEDPTDGSVSSDDADASATADDATSDDSADADDSATDGSGGANNVIVVVGDTGSSDASTPVVVQNASDGYLLPYSDTYLYSADDLSVFSDWELYLARNEIYARHGREFNNDDLQRYFNSQSWYTPLYTPEEFDAMSGSILNDVERENATTILSVEQARGSAYI